MAYIVGKIVIDSEEWTFWHAGSRAFRTGSGNNFYEYSSWRELADDLEKHGKHHPWRPKQNFFVRKMSAIKRLLKRKILLGC